MTGLQLELPIAPSADTAQLTNYMPESSVYWSTLFGFDYSIYFGLCISKQIVE